MIDPARSLTTWFVLVTSDVDGSTARCPQCGDIREWQHDLVVRLGLWLTTPVVVSVGDIDVARLSAALSGSLRPVNGGAVWVLDRQLPPPCRCPVGDVPPGVTPRDLQGSWAVDGSTVGLLD